MRRLLLAGLLLVAPSLVAQAGTTTWSIRGSLPDTAQAMAGLSEFELLFTFATDGSRLGMQIVPGPTMVASVVAADLSTVRFQAVVNATGDSLALGVVLPPDLAAQMGGAIGFRLDMAIPDSLPLPTPGGIDLDSLLSANDEAQPNLVNTGRTAVVAGIRCEEWKLVAPDSAPSPLGQPVACLAEPMPAFTAFNDLVQQRLPGMSINLEELRAASRKFFGGRDLVMIRMRLGEPGKEFTFQLESVSDAPPDAAFFTLPDGLQPFPLEALMGMMQSAMPQEPTET